MADGLNRYTSAAGLSLGYDARGNTTNDGTKSYAYDSSNRLVSASNGAAAVHDPSGRLYQISQGGATTRFLFDGTRVIGEYNGSSTLLRRHVHGAGVDEVLAWYNGAGTTERRHVFADERGSVMAEDTGSAVNTRRYDEYGNADGPYAGRFQYTGQMWLGELGLNHYKARAYSPKLGRFLQTDPIGYQDQMNLYAYVGNDPMNATDPSGRQTAADLWRRMMQAPVPTPTPEQVFDGTGTAIDVIAIGADIASMPSGEGLAIAAGRRSLWDAAKNFFRREASGKCCFVAGTLVDTEAGLRPIEEIKIGDRVWARDVETGETALKPVTDLISRHERTIWEVALSGPDGETERFETTDDHPWWIAGQGWKKTADLAAGMAVVTKDDRGMTVTSVVETERADSTFNLTIADFETYFVGDKGVLVHNCPTGSYTNTHASGKTYDGKGDAERGAKSARGIAKANDDPLVKTETQTHATDRESFKQEARNLEAHGGPKSDSNYNKIESPGKKMLDEDEY